MTDRIDTAALRLAHEATTQGVWQASPAQEGNGSFSSYLYAEGYGVVGYWRGHKHWHTDANWLLTDSDARFIALAHEQWPALLDEIERMRGLLKPFAALADEADKLRHGPGSTCTWRLAYDDLAAARTALGEPMPPPPEQGQSTSEAV